MQVHRPSLYPSTADLRSTTAGRAGLGMKLEETVAESMSHLLICKVTLLWNTIAYREISASDLSESDGPHYASAIARTAPSSKSSLNTSPTAIMTAIQALSTLLLHRAVDAQQPKHRPLPERYRHRIRAKATVTLCFSYSQDGIIIQIQPEHLTYSYNDGFTSSLHTAAALCSRCTAAEASTSS